MDLIAFDRPSESSLVERIWHSYGGDTGMPFISIAENHWSMVVSRYQDKMTLTIRGPETFATPAYAPSNVEFFGIVFKHGALMPDFPARMLKDRNDLNLPLAASNSFWLKGCAWQFPDFENADTFVDWLEHEGLLVHDPLVAAVVNEQSYDVSLRTAQRRFLQATGMTYSTLQQIKRARNATTLLKEGTSILDTVDLAGYSDQPHMTRSLKHYIGQTPAQLASEQREDSLSFLFKTHPF